MKQFSSLSRSRAALGRPSTLAAALAVAGLLAFQSSAHGAFEGPYAPAAWELININSDGYLDAAGAPASITLAGPDNESDAYGDTQLFIQAAASGTVSFDWVYTSDDEPGYDFAWYYHDGWHFLSEEDGESGSVSFEVVAGQLFGFSVDSDDNLFGRGYLTISNFTAPVPEPGTYGLMALGLLAVGAAARRRAA